MVVEKLRISVDIVAGTAFGLASRGGKPRACPELVEGAAVPT
jgi:hypothetical protein